jgi:SPW repeat
MNRPIKSRAHAMLDYPAGILLIASPWIFGFADDDSAAKAVPIVIGILVLLQSLITDYEFSVADLLPLRMHLGMDVLAGIVLAASPWIFGFADEGTEAWLPHLVLGLALIASGLMTNPVRETPRRRADGRARAV